MAKAPPGRPNIVIFVGDDLDADDIGPYGNKVVRTPNLDRLAKESLLFTRTFAGSPTCSPSRSTLFTGLLPFRHGAHGNHSGVREDVRSLAHYLQPLGYRVVIAGKLHVGPENVFPFGRISGTNVPEPGFEKKPGLNFDLNMDPVDTWLSEKGNEQPFLLIVTDHSPHVIWPERSTYHPADVEIPSKHIDTEDTRVSRARYYEDITKMDSNVGKLLHSLEEHALSENTVFVFTADQGPQWPFAKWSLYDDGLQVPMLVRWPGQVKANSRTDVLVSLADVLPTFVEIAGGEAPGQIDGQSFLKVLTGEKNNHRKEVFASHTGDGMMNRSPARMLRSGRYKYILNLAPENTYHTHIDHAKDHDGGREYWDSWVERSKTDKHAAAVLQRYHHRPAEEFYDLEADPDETNNLANDNTYAQLIAGYRTRLAAWRQGQGDFETGPEQLNQEPRVKGQKPVAPYVFE
ncbi:MAG: sulfatase [Chryseosolibacter sp.]